jgi:hypothetical protein
VRDVKEALIQAAKDLGLQATAYEPAERARFIMAENERLRAALERAASIAFNGVEEEGYPGSVDRRPETLRDAILALRID